MAAALGARVLFAAMATALMLSRVASYPDFVSQVPNGANVPGAPEIGHVPHDWPERNAFGQDFDDAGREWTRKLCEADSDEDGQTNGQELGDPCSTSPTSSQPSSDEMQPNETKAIEETCSHLLDGGDGCKKAICSFLSIPGCEKRGEDLLKALLSTERLRLAVAWDVLLEFMEALRDEWILAGCKVLHEEAGPLLSVVIARLIFDVMTRSSGTTLIQAETDWIRWVHPVGRAIVNKSPVTITSVVGNNMLYAAGDSFAYDKYRRRVFCWTSSWTADQNKEIWTLVAAAPDSFYILNRFAKEYLYASAIAAADGDEGYDRKQAFLWRGGELPGDYGRWQLIPLDDGNCALYNPAQDTFLVSPLDAGEGTRRSVQATGYRPLDSAWNESHLWKLASVAPSRMERALDAFFGKEYALAVKLLTEILEKEDPLRDARTKVLCYRMIANLRLENKGSFKMDANELREAGGFGSDLFPVLGVELSSYETANLAEWFMAKPCQSSLYIRLRFGPTNVASFANFSTMMAIAEVTAQDADCKAPPALQLFVRCSRLPPQESPGADALVVELVDALDVWQASISPAQKPRALACSPSEYMAAVEAAFSPLSTGQQPRFQFKWSRKKRVMTLMESATTTGFAMKYTAITFSALPSSVDQEKVTTAGYLGNLLHDVVERDARTRNASAKQEQELRGLETLLKEKDAVLERALAAKQAVEDQLFDGFCAVLNAKKDEIQRLQNELALAEARGGEMSSNGGKKAPAKRTKAATKRPRKAAGAKIKRKAEEEEVEMSDRSDRDHSDEESSSDGDEDTGAESGKRRKRVKRDAIEAYSQIPMDLRRGAVRISSAEDVLSDLDAIMKSEVEANDAALQAKAGSSTKRGRKTSPWMRPRVESAPSSQADASEGQAGPSAIQDKDSAKKPRVPARQVSPVKAADSEDEDILDMLS